MFDVKLNLSVEIEGRPESGIPAIDFRRQHGLPEVPTNVIDIPVDQHDETVVRKFADFANAEGNLEDSYNPRFGIDTRSNSSLTHSLSERNFVTRHVVSTVVIREVIASRSFVDKYIGKDELESLLGELVEDRRSAQWRATKAENDAKKEKEVADLVKVWLEKSPEERYRDAIVNHPGQDCGKHWSTNDNIPGRDLLYGFQGGHLNEKFPNRTYRPELQPVVDDILAEIARRNNDDLQQAELVRFANAEKSRLAHEANVADLRRFVAEHGSEDLKFMVGSRPDQPSLWKKFAQTEKNKRDRELMLAKTTEFCVAHPEFVMFESTDWFEKDAQENLAQEKLPLAILAQQERDQAAFPSAKVTVSRLVHDDERRHAHGVFLDFPGCKYVTRIIPD